MDFDTSFFIAQGFGVLTLIAYIISTQVNTNLKVLIWRIIYSGIYTLQYIFLGAFAGCVSSAVQLVSYLVYTRYSYKKSVPTFWVIFFSVLTLIIGLIFYDGPLSLLPLAHTIIGIIFLAKNNLTLFRFSQVFSSILMFVYNISVGAYIGVIMVAIQFIATILGIVRFDSEEIKKIFTKKRNSKNKTKKKSRR